MANRRTLWTAVAGFLVFLSLNIPPRMAAAIRSGVMGVFQPFISFGDGILDGISAAGGVFAGRVRLARQNDELRKRVRELSLENASLRGLAIENKRLRRLLQFRGTRVGRMLPAQVVGRDTRQWYSSILIDKGSADGVRSEMPVVCEGGIVGKVTEAGHCMSTVLLIVDRRSRIGALVERTREAGVLEGTSFNTCRLNYLPRGTAARQGDRVVSSGLGGIYPKGMPIGEITGVHEAEHGLYGIADVAPGADFAALEEVLVVTEKGEKEEDFLR